MERVKSKSRAPWREREREMVLQLGAGSTNLMFVCRTEPSSGPQYQGFAHGRGWEIFFVIFFLGLGSGKVENDPLEQKTPPPR